MGRSDGLIDRTGLGGKRKIKKNAVCALEGLMGVKVIWCSLFYENARKMGL